MKIRQGFVSNSSSTSFIIKNKTNKQKTLMDFIEETSVFLYKIYIQKYPYHLWKDSQDESYREIFSAESVKSFIQKRNFRIKGNKEIGIIFADDQTSTENFYELMLRDFNETESFSWQMDENLH
ncbi:hypothetical protein M0R19_03230 [Candidatus Pacearchaeota archaeon]|jgi:hypothetical protein|nr:hypothetical protein [Candidatus Pacearchaeota archaeon]